MGLLTGFTTIIVVIVCGSALAHAGVLDTRSQRTLGEIAFFVASPALMVVTISRVDVSGALANLAASAGALGTCFVLYALLARLVWRLDTGSVLIGSLSSSYVNAGNLGIAFAAYVVGDITVVVPTLLVQMLAVQPVALVVLDRLTGRGTGALSVLRRLVTNPLTLATLLGVALAVTGWELPTVVASPLQLLAGAAIPLMLLSYGAALRLSPVVGRAGHNREVLAISVLKLAVMPVVAWGLGVALDLHDTVLLGVVITAALPTAQNIFLHATRYRVGEDVSRESILVTTLCSLPVALIVALLLGLKEHHMTLSSLDPGLLDRLRAELGPAGLLTEPADVAAYCSDWRGAHTGTAPAVLRPASTAEVATAVRLCHRAGVALVPQGGNTGLCGGAVPDTSGTQVVLSLGRMRAVRALDTDADTVTVEAGVVLADLQRAAADAGRLFPLSLGAEGSCTVGGNLATNAGGTAVLRYGMMRDLTLGLEVVLPDGRVWDGLRPLRKDNAGYDLTQLFVGSEGTLGVITAAVLRLVPATPRRATAWVALPDVAAAVSWLPALRARASESLTAYELVSRQALDLVLAHVPGARDPFGERHPWYGLVELAGPQDADLDGPLETALSDGLNRGLLVDAVVAGSPAQRNALWELREGISEAQNPEGPSLKHDVTVPIGSLPSFVAATADALAAVLAGVRLVTYGHVGDGNLHHNLSAPPGMPDADFLADAAELTATIYDHVAACGGSISAEHGLGVAKRDAAARYLDPVELSLMRAVKDALDPHGLMNPGKVLVD